MAESAGTVTLPDLVPVAAEVGAAEGDPRLVYTWIGPSRGAIGHGPLVHPVRWGRSPLVYNIGPDTTLGVWDTGTGAFLGALQGPGPGPNDSESFITYQRPSDGPRIAAGSSRGRLTIWDGDDFQLLHAVQVDAKQRAVTCLAVYEEPTSGRQH
jgi:WD40 repeat protein